MAGVLLHIGFRKAASTFIRDWFCFHPELKVMVINGSSEFPGSDRPAVTPQWYVFSDAYLAPRNHNIPKDRKNLKAYQCETCAMLKEKFPDARILIITRSAEACIMSEYSEYIKHGGTRHFKDIEDTEAYEYFTGYYDYNYVIGLYDAAFGRDHQIVLPAEMLEYSPDLFIKTLENGLGLNHYNFTFSRKNPSLSPRQLWGLRVISKAVYNFTRIFGKKGDLAYQKYKMYLGNKSYENNKFSMMIGFMNLFRKQNIDRPVIPAKLVSEMKINATILKEFPVFKWYIDQYCPI